MSTIKADTVKMKDSGKRMIELASQYDQKLVSFYNRINQINKKTGEWVGVDAERYIADVNSSKIAYELVGKIIKEYAYLLINSAEEIDMLAEETKIP
ncbi:MAG: hypothetical protein HFG40_03075 [Bacilli bacterium]|nr:hypothetical protein [Bacilli bacterium]